MNKISTILGIIKMSNFCNFCQKSCNFHRQTNCVNCHHHQLYYHCYVKQKKNHNAWNQWCIYISQKPLYCTNAISISIFPRSTCNLLKSINPLLKLGKKELKILQNPNLTRLWRSFVAQFLLISMIEKNFLTYRNLLGKGHTRPF